MKARVIETGEIVNVTPYPTWYKENGQGPDRREWDEDELEFIRNTNSPKTVSLDNVCDYLKSFTYQEYPGGPIERMIDDDIIKQLRKEFE